jgi:NTE family protein
MIRNIAIKGGGVKGIAYVGALRELENAGVLKDIQRYAGTSAGSLVAAMLAVGHSVESIEKMMRSLDFKKFESGGNPFRIFTLYGLYSGDYIVQFINKILISSPLKLSPKLTFREMKEAGCKELYVFACNVNSQQVIELSAEKTPDVLVAEAIRASMSIPFFFRAFRFTQGIATEHIFVDGGVVFNYPLSFFDQSRFMEKDDKELDLESIGMFLYSKENKPHKKLRFNTPMFFAKQLFESLMDSQDIQVHEDHEQVARSIMIDDLHYSATDFTLSKDDMDKLIQSGSLAAKEFIKNYIVKSR